MDWITILCLIVLAIMLLGLLGIMVLHSLAEHDERRRRHLKNETENGKEETPDIRKKTDRS